MHLVITIEMEDVGMLQVLSMIEGVHSLFCLSISPMFPKYCLQIM